MTSLLSWWRRPSGARLADGARGARRGEPQTWLWVVRPEYYLDTDGSERADLDPANGYSPSGWWTCDQATLAGDLALIYRTSPRSDIAYLARAESDAYPLEPGAGLPGSGSHVCDYAILRRFEAPLPIAEMRPDPALAGWGALRRNFQGATHRIDPATWARLLDRLAVDPSALEQVVEQRIREYRLEKDIEDAMSLDPSPLDRFGGPLDLVARQHTCSLGGRSDLVYRNRRTKRLVVVELKQGLVDRNAVAQVLSYMASAQRDHRGRGRPLGVLVGEAMDRQAAGIVAGLPDVSFVTLAELGFTRAAG